MSNFYRVILLLMLTGSLLSFSGCGQSSSNLIISRVTHFLVQGNGESLNFPLFAETISVETIERDLAIAEYYHKKLAELYNFKSFNLVNSTLDEYLSSSAADFDTPHLVYEYEDSLTSISLSLVHFGNLQADYSFCITDQRNHQTRHHAVSVQNDQSASIGLLFDEENNRGHLVVIQLYSLEITPETEPQQFADFLKHKNSVSESQSGSVFIKGDQRWMDELFGHRGIQLPVKDKLTEKGERELVDFDTPPSPVKGMIAFQEAVQYPKNARDAGREGRVLLKVFIDETGKVTDCSVMKGAAADLDSAAIAAAKSIEFNPATKDGEPVTVWVTIPFDFRLK